MELKQGTFNALIGSLLEWELIGEEFREELKKEGVLHNSRGGYYIELYQNKE